MLHFFKQRNLTNGSARNTFIFLFKSNLLQRDGFIRYTVTCLVNDAVCSFTNLLHLFVLQNRNSQNQNRSVLKLKIEIEVENWCIELTCSIVKKKNDLVKSEESVLKWNWRSEKMERKVYKGYSEVRLSPRLISL